MLALGVGETITDGVQIYRLEDDLNLHFWKLGNKADHYASTAGLKLLLEIHSEDKNETN